MVVLARGLELGRALGSRVWFWWYSRQNVLVFPQAFQPAHDNALGLGTADGHALDGRDDVRRQGHGHGLGGLVHVSAGGVCDRGDAAQGFLSTALRGRVRELLADVAHEF